MQGVQAAAVVVPPSPPSPPQPLGASSGHSHLLPPLPLSASLGAPPLVVVVAVGVSPLPSSSLMPHPAVIVAVGAWWVAVAVGVSPLVLVVVWCPPGRRRHCGLFPTAVVIL